MTNCWAVARKRCMVRYSPRPNKLRAKSNEQRAESNEQRAKSNKRPAKGSEQ